MVSDCCGSRLIKSITVPVVYCVLLFNLDLFYSLLKTVNLAKLDEQLEVSRPLQPNLYVVPYCRG